MKCSTCGRENIKYIQLDTFDCGRQICQLTRSEEVKVNTMQMVLTEEKADLYDAALDHVNDVRKELGLDPVTELLPGYVAEASKCPISRSIVQGIDDSYCASSWQRTTVYNVPVDVASDIDINVKEHIVLDAIGMSDLAFRFQKAFDREEFPELIAE